MKSATSRKTGSYRDKLVDILDNLMEGCQVIGFDWRYLYINARAAAYGRQPVEGLLGRTVMEMYPGFEQTDMYTVLQKCMLQRIHCDQEFEFTHENGEKRWYEFRIQPVKEGIFILSDDITSRKEREMVTASSEKKYRRLFENMQEGVALCRMVYDDGHPVDFIYLDVNDKFTELTGLSDVTGKPVTEVIPGIGESDPELFERYNRVVTTGNAERFEYFLEAMQQWFSLSVYRPEEDHFVAIFDVITGRKEKEIELQESIARLGLALDAARGGTWEWDLITQKNYWSKELWSVYGLEPYSCEPSYDAWRDTIYPPDRDSVATAVSKAAMHGEELYAEWRVCDTDGTLRWLMSRGRPVRDDDGRPVKYIGVVLDITTRKMEEQQAFRWHRVFNTSNLPLAIADARTNRFHQVNRAFATQRGYEPDELTGMPVIEIYDPAVRTKVVEMIREIDAVGHGVFETTHRRIDGTLFPVMLDLTIIRDESGEPSTRVAYALDITEQQLLRHRDNTRIELLTMCNNAASFKQLMGELILFFKRLTECEAVGIRLSSELDFPYYETNGFSPDFIAHENFLCCTDEKGVPLRDEEGNPVMDCMCGRILTNQTDRSKPWFTEKGSFWTGHSSQLPESWYHSGRLSKSRNRCTGSGYESIALIPLKVHGKTFGLVQFNDHREHFITAEKVTELEQLVGYASIAMAKMEADEALRALNAVLERRVLERTHELELANEILTLNAHHIEDLYNHAPCGYHSLDADGLVVDINDTELDWIGFTRDEVVGKMKFQSLFSAASRERFYSLFSKFKAEGFVHDLEFELITRSGHILPVLISGTAIYDESGNFVKSRSTVIDFTEVKRVREEIIEKSRLLEMANHELESFTYSVSHDLRAPLRAIDGFTQILVEEYNDRLDENGRSVTGTIRANAQKMSNLIDVLLRFSRIGRTDISRTTVSMQALVEECIQELLPPDGTSEIRIETPLPVVHVDQPMIRQVWLNLLSNAVKYSAKADHPEVVISCSVDNDIAIFSVSDNGVGFDMKYINKLFGVFQRLHSQREFEGIGVGLAIVHRIIERHGGKVWAESTPGKGATFYFSLNIKSS